MDLPARLPAGALEQCEDRRLTTLRERVARLTGALATTACSSLAMHGGGPRRRGARRRSAVGQSLRRQKDGGVLRSDVRAAGRSGGVPRPGREVHRGPDGLRVRDERGVLYGAQSHRTPIVAVLIHAGWDFAVSDIAAVIAWRLSCDPAPQQDRTRTSGGRPIRQAGQRDRRAPEQRLVRAVVGRVARRAAHDAFDPASSTGPGAVRARAAGRMHR